MAGSNRHKGLVTLVVAGLSLAIIMGGTLLPTATWADSPNRVGLIVRHGDGSLITQCIEFSQPQISGYDVLVLSGLHLQVSQDSGLGAAICSIDHEGCSPDDCFCQCHGYPCVYWSYWHLVDGTWSYSQGGASGYYVSDGDVEGWAWGGDDEVELPQVAFDDICAPLATATSTSTATPTFTPTATHTPLPTTTPTSTSVPPTPSVGFSVQPGTVMTGGCAELRWDVEDAQAVYLDGQPREGHGSQQACPAQTQTYELRVVNAAGEFHHQVTVNVVQPSPTPIPPDTYTPLPTATPTTQPEVPSPTPTSLPTEVPPAATQPPGHPTAQLPTPSPPAVVMVIPPTALMKKEADASPKADQPAEIFPNVTMLNRLLFLAAAVLGTLGFGGMAFVGILAVLGVIYLFARWSQDGEGDYGEEGDVDGHH